MTIEELKNQKLWINWKKESIDGKYKKIPYSFNGAKTGTNLFYLNSWTTFDKVNNKLDGVGLILKNGICGIDIDNRDLNDNVVKEILELMDSYAEISPSGNGIHILFTCDINKIPHYINSDGTFKLDDNYYQKNPNNKIECYISSITNRYFTFTENKINDKEINERTEQLIKFLNLYMKKDNYKIQNKQTIYKIDNEDIINIISKSKQKEKFKKLYFDGDISDYSEDDSCADLALCNILAFYTQGNEKQIDELFRDSALYREKWERNDYRKMTIKKAIDSCNDNFYNTETIKKSKELSIENLKSFLDKKNISVKYNEIKNEIEFEGNYNGICNTQLAEFIATLIHSDLKQKYKHCEINVIQKYLRVIGIKNTYNPVSDIIKNLTWDKHDYFKDLTIILGIENDELSCTLLYKWLWQCLSLLENSLDSPFGADGMLVLQGPQGIGKTTFVKKIAFDGQFCNLGKSLNFYDKDTKRWCCNNWIVELGEIETSLKSNIEQLKAFITDDIDIFRLPYASTDTKKVRKTSLIGTCNSIDFLIDKTGNRRFWTINIKSINLKKLETFNIKQLWAQIKFQTQNDLQGFRLNKEESLLLEKRNKLYEKTLAGEDEIIDILSIDNSKVEYKEITVSEFKNLYNQLEKYSLQQISKVLNYLNIPLKTSNNKKLRFLPVPKRKSLFDEIR